jgi:hypothetical protein
MTGVQKYKEDENVCLGAFVCDMTASCHDVGGVSGALLGRFRPPTPPWPDPAPCQGGRMVWLAIGLLCVSSPLGLLVCKGCIQQPMAAAEQQQQGGRRADAATYELAITRESLDAGGAAKCVLLCQQAPAETAETVALLADDE